MELIDAISRMQFRHKIWRPPNHLKSPGAQSHLEERIKITRKTCFRDNGERVARAGKENAEGMKTRRGGGGAGRWGIETILHYQTIWIPFPSRDRDIGGNESLRVMEHPRSVGRPWRRARDSGAAMRKEPVRESAPRKWFLSLWRMVIPFRTSHPAPRNSFSRVLDVASAGATFLHRGGILFWNFSPGPRPAPSPLESSLDPFDGFILRSVVLSNRFREFLRWWDFKYKRGTEKKVWFFWEKKLFLLFSF